MLILTIRIHNKDIIMLAILFCPQLWSRVCCGCMHTGSNFVDVVYGNQRKQETAKTKRNKHGLVQKLNQLHG